MKRFSIKALIVLVLVAAVLYLLLGGRGASMYTASEPVGMDASAEQLAPAQVSGPSRLDNACSLGNGVGLSSALLPHDVATQEDYGQFAPDNILMGQNFLDPTQQIGIPETLGGSLRNSSHDLRAEPVIPKSMYTWNNSTITPDLMMRSIC